MSTAQQIANAINERVKNSQSPNYKAWRIGLTHDIDERYNYWKRPEHFLYWEANSLEDAQAVETHFINKMGMQGGTGGDLDDNKTVFVYIF